MGILKIGILSFISFINGSVGFGQCLDICPAIGPPKLMDVSIFGNFI
jgi:hypothetical protein